jgi:hypothetical protein
MRNSAGVGALSAIVFGISGLAWTALELVPQSLGFNDTDDPAVSLAYLRENAEVYAMAGIALLVMSLALTIVVFAIWDLLVGRSGSLALRTVSAMGLMASASFFLFGVLRYGVYPMLYIDGLNPAWGEVTYLVGQMAGVHGVAQAAILLGCSWALGVALLGVRSGVLPRWLALLAILPAVRLLSLLGPTRILEGLPGELWIILMLAIPGTMAWFILLGVAMLRSARVSPQARS